MATRLERLAEQAARAQEKLAQQKQALAQVQAATRAEQQKARNRRCYAVGKLVLDTPLATLPDATLHQLFTVLAPLVAMPDPVVRLAGLLRDASGPPGTSLPGCAHAAHGVAPPVPW